MNKAVGVIIGLDVGMRRIGVARGDAEVKVAAPLDSILNDGNVVESLAHVVKTNDAKAIVVGLPRNSEGTETNQSQFSRDFAAKIENVLGLPVLLQDESLTSVIAEENLRARRNFREQMLRDGTLDSEAAALILSDFLERSEHATTEN